MGKATELKLGDLHGDLAVELSKRIREGEIEVVMTEDDDGTVVQNEVKKPCASAILNVARQFLKDNGIEADPGDEVMNDLVDELPFSESEDNSGSANHAQIH